MLGISVQQPLYTYVLISPVTGGPIYVGKGIHDRAYKHRFQKSPIGAHVRELAASRLKPIVERLPAKDADEAFEMEELLVEMIGRRDIGTGPLFNCRPGGRRVVHTEDAKRRIAASRIGKPLSEEHKRKVSMSLMGRKPTVDPKRQSEIMKAWWAMRKSKQSQELMAVS